MMNLVPARGVALGLALTALAAPAAAQTSPAGDPVLRAIREEGTVRSQLEPLARVLLDSIGPRLSASPGMEAAQEWALAKYRSWGITARNERYGAWRGWEGGVTHVDLLAPRVRTLEAELAPWSPGTPGPVEGGVVLFPEASDPAELRAWLPQARGKFVMVAFPEPTCRPDESWERWARPETLRKVREERREAAAAWQRRIAASGMEIPEIVRKLEGAGAAGVVTSRWKGGWGVYAMHVPARTERIPTVNLGCEDHSLLHRLLERGWDPRIRVSAEAKLREDVPVSNTIAEIRGTERPEEYVVLSAHFDSWDGASGATDNGTGTLIMMEAMRILKAVLPAPKRTILAGHWTGEEQGLHGSRAWAADNPRVVEGIQVLLNQDNGTGRIADISLQGFTGAEAVFRRWLSRLPEEVAGQIRLDAPGLPSTGGSDHSSFVCAGAPGVNLRALDWDYGTYTWHTNLDSYDKVVFDDLRDNALLVAMLAYLASEDPERVPRERRTDLVNTVTGERGVWPECREAARSWP